MVAGAASRNHIHSMVRTPNGNGNGNGYGYGYGFDLLIEHPASHPHD